MEDSWDEQAPVPRVLAHAERVWYVAAAAATACVAYLALDLGAVRNGVEQRLTCDLATDPAGAAPPQDIPQLATAAPIAMLAAIVVLYAAQYPFLRGIARRRSRGCRSFFVALAVVTLLVVPVAADLVLRSAGWIRYAAYLQIPVLFVAAALVLRRGVGDWLPPTVRRLGAMPAPRRFGTEDPTAG